MGCNVFSKESVWVESDSQGNIIKSYVDNHGLVREYVISNKKTKSNIENKLGITSVNKRYKLR